MKRLVVISIMLFAACIAAFAALVSLPGPIVVPWASPAVVLIGTSYLTVNDDTDEMAYICQIPKTGTLTQLAFTVGTVTVADTAVPVRIVNLTTGGNPDDASLYKTSPDSTGTANISTSSTVVAASINGGTGVSCTLGDVIGVVIQRTASTGTLNAQIKYNQIPGNALPQIQDYNITAGTTWTKTVGSPMLMFNIGGWTAPIGCSGGGLISLTSSTIASPAEAGILVNLPFSARAIGVAAQVIFPAASSAKFTLYSDPTGTPVSRAATPAIDTDISTSISAARPFRSYFTAPFTISANTNYVVAMSPQDATSLSLQYFSCNATYAASNPTGSGGVLYSRANSASGAFSPTTTNIPIMGLIIDQVDSGGTGGPNFISQYDKINPHAVFGSGEGPLTAVRTVTRPYNVSPSSPREE